METAYLHEFAKVAECGSFTAAARELHLTQSTLSKHVALLEREFGADLFVRDRSGVSLTEAGGVLYAQARQMEKLLRATELLVRAARAGRLRARLPVSRRARVLSTARPRPRGHGAARASAGSRPSAAGSTGASWARCIPATWEEARLSRRSRGELALDARTRWPTWLGSVYRKLGVGDKQEAPRFHPFRFGMMVDAPAAVGHTA